MEVSTMVGSFQTADGKDYVSFLVSYERPEGALVIIVPNNLYTEEAQGWISPPHHRCDISGYSTNPISFSNTDADSNGNGNTSSHSIIFSNTDHTPIRNLTTSIRLIGSCSTIFFLNSFFIFSLYGIIMKLDNHLFCNDKYLTDKKFALTRLILL